MPRLARWFDGVSPGSSTTTTWVFTAPVNAIAAPFGRGCPTSNGVPVLAPTALPVLGTVYALTLYGAPPVSLAVVVHGLDNEQYAPGSWLPLPLAAIGLAGCGLEVRPDVTFVELPQRGTFTHFGAIPSVPSLAGVALFSQALVLDSQAPNGFGGMSNAVHARLGF